MVYIPSLLNNMYRITYLIMENQGAHGIVIIFWKGLENTLF